MSSINFVPSEMRNRLVMAFPRQGAIPFGACCEGQVRILHVYGEFSRIEKLWDICCSVC